MFKSGYDIDSQFKMLLSIVWFFKLFFNYYILLFIGKKKGFFKIRL